MAGKGGPEEMGEFDASEVSSILTTWFSQIGLVDVSNLMHALSIVRSASSGHLVVASSSLRKTTGSLPSQRMKISQDGKNKCSLTMS